MCKTAMYSAIIIITKHQHWICYFIIGKVNNKPTKLVIHVVSFIKYMLWLKFSPVWLKKIQTT